jgi:hypothetical protein
MNNTANPPDQLCSLEEVCGFGGFHGQEPNQWFRCDPNELEKAAQVDLF